jgi:hypothetical protein
MRRSTGAVGLARVVFELEVAAAVDWSWMVQKTT